MTKPQTPVPPLPPDAQAFPSWARTVTVVAYTGAPSWARNLVPVPPVLQPDAYSTTRGPGEAPPRQA